MSFFLLQNTKEDILKNVVTKLLLKAIDLQSHFNEGQWLPATVCAQYV